MLSLHQKKKFEDEGYLVVENFLNQDEIDNLKSEAAYLIENRESTEDANCFADYVKSGKDASEYARQSADKISFFFEEKAFDKNGTLRRPVEQSILKIGHALHDCNSHFDKFSRQAKIESLISDLGMQDPLIVQSMYFYKQPRIGSEVQIHQDSSFLYTTPMTCTGLWFALEDATIDNGCLRVLPGSHQDGLTSRFLRTANGEVFESYAEPSASKEQYLPLIVPQGSVVVLHGLLQHYSDVNRSEKSRQAYTLHFVERDAEYSQQNWLLRSKDHPFRGFKV